MTRYFRGRCRAFSFERHAREQRVAVDHDGTVRVYDDIAGGYTTCHSLADRIERRLRRLAGVRVTA